MVKILIWPLLLLSGIASDLRHVHCALVIKWPQQAQGNGYPVEAKRKWTLEIPGKGNTVIEIDTMVLFYGSFCAEEANCSEVTNKN